LGLLDPATTAGLNDAKANVGPKTQKAIDDALNNQLLTADDVSYLKGALEKNPKLTPAQKLAITNALLADATAKGKLQGGGLGGGTVVINGSGLGGGTEVITTGSTGHEVVTTGAAGSGETTVATGAETGGAGNFLTVRYLSVANRTGERLTVYAQTPDREEPWTWTFEPGEKANLSVNGKWLTTDVAWVWAESAKNQWIENKEKAVVLVEQPYEADAIDTYTYAFNP
jgi:hypothetical protein